MLGLSNSSFKVNMISGVCRRPPNTTLHLETPTLSKMVPDQIITDPDDAPQCEITDCQGVATNNNLDKIPSDCAEYRAENQPHVCSVSLSVGTNILREIWSNVTEIYLYSKLYFQFWKRKCLTLYQMKEYWFRNEIQTVLHARGTPFSSLYFVIGDLTSVDGGSFDPHASYSVSSAQLTVFQRASLLSI